MKEIMKIGGLILGLGLFLTYGPYLLWFAYLFISHFILQHTPEKVYAIEDRYVDGYYRLVMSKPIFPYTYPMEAHIKGDSCDNLTGEVMRFERDDPQYAGAFYCFPYVDDIKKYLGEGTVEFIDLDNSEISFKNGPILFPAEPRFKSDIQKKIAEERPDYMNSTERAFNHYQKRMERVLEQGRDAYKSKDIYRYEDITDDVKFVLRSAGSGGQFIRINEIMSCSDPANDTHNSFCVSADFYEAEPKWDVELIVYCWKCTRLKKSRQAVQDAILFTLDPSYRMALDGGFAIREDLRESFNSGGRYESWRSKLQHAGQVGGENGQE